MVDHPDSQESMSTTTTEAFESLKYPAPISGVGQNILKRWDPRALPITQSAAKPVQAVC